MKKRRITFIFVSSLIAFALVVGVIFFVMYFNKYTNKKITTASLTNLEETYGEVSKMFEQNSRSQFNYLDELGNYLYANADNTSEVETYVLTLKERYGFSYFYFISDDGSYYEISGETGRFNLGSRIFNLDEQIIESAMPKKEELILYTKDVTNNSFKGFSYSTLAFAYDKVSIETIIDTSSYNNTSLTYLVSSNGKVRVSFDTNQTFYNLFEFLTTYSDISDESFNKIKDDFNNNNNNNSFEVTVKGITRYMVYSYTGISDYMLITFTPKSVVDSSLTSVKNVSITMIAVMFSLIVLTLGVFILYLYIKNVKDKNSMIKERDELFFNATKNLDEIYILYSLVKNKVKYVSVNIERLLGITYKDVKNDLSNLYKCIDSNDIDTKNFRGNYYKEEYLINLKTGARCLYSVESRLSDDSKSVIIVLANKERDMKIREEIESSLELARVASNAKTTFLSNMSHDIRTPMNAIIGFSNLIKKDVSNIDKVDDYTDKILNASSHLLAMLNDILDLSKIESGKTVLNINEVSISSVIDSLVDIIEPQMTTKNQKFKVINNINKDIVVYADQTRLSQILLNILSNAYKYTNDGGEITFEINESISNSSYITYNFKVIDNGIGMSEEYLRKLFVPFEREHSKYESKIEGTGLGMSITKNLIDMMNGSISVESKLDVGSTFDITLSFKLKDEVEIKEIKTKEVSLKGLKALACEDNELNREILCEMLESEGIVVDVATNGRQAVDKVLEGNQYDFILMDIQMPIMDGYEATKLIRLHDKCVPIIAMTASALIEDEIKALECGMNSHISKPLDINVLKNKLSEVIKK